MEPIRFILKKEYGQSRFYPDERWPIQSAALKNIREKKTYTEENIRALIALGLAVEVTEETRHATQNRARGR